MSGDDLLLAAQRSIAELCLHGREPVRIRLHPLDAETIIASRQPEHAGKTLTQLLGLDVELDESSRLGEPVAEWESNTESRPE